MAISCSSYARITNALEKKFFMKHLAFCLLFPFFLHSAHASLQDEQSLTVAPKSLPAVSAQLELGKLSNDECESLKEICSLFTTDLIGPIPMEPRLGWIKKEALDDLKILTYLDQKKPKFDRSLDMQLQMALKTFYHLSLNVELKMSMALLKAYRETVLSSLKRPLLEPTDLLRALSRLHKTPKMEFKEFSPYLPTLRKMTRNILRYVQERRGLSLNETYGVVPLEDTGTLLLGYVKDSQGYIPVALEKIPDFELHRLPIEDLPQDIQRGCLVKDGQIIEDSGLFVKNEDCFGITYLRQAYVYCGIDHEHPFSLSPFQLLSAPSAFIGASPEEDYLTQLLGDDLPQPGGKATFIPLPRKENDKNILELLFLEDLKVQREQGNTEAIKMIAYIEEEAGKTLEQVIEELTEEQLKIIAEQQAISKAVAEDSVIGRQKNIATVKKKDKKQKSHKASGKEEIVKQPSASERTLPGQRPSNILDELKQKGRHKYRKALGLINRAMKSTTSQTLTENLKGGSHKTLHGEKGTVTLVKPHGKKDLTLSGRGLKRFSERLLSLVDLN